jgi:hypothetical protein
MRSMRTLAAFALVISLGACSEQDRTGVVGPTTNPHFYEGGVSGRSGAPGDGLCSGCHRANGNAPTVTLSGPATLGPGQTGDYTLTIEPASDSDQQQGGLNVAVPDGGTLLAGSGTVISSGEIVQSQARRGSGTLSWSFQWQAPSAGGTYTMYGVGLSTDGSGTSGDEEGTDALAITVQAANTPPSADAKQVETSMNTPADIVLSGSDAETCNLTFAIVSGPSNGSLSGISDQACGGGGDQAQVTYTPAADYTGSDQFTYSVTDEDGASAQATVDINVLAPGSSPPNADSKNVGTDIDTPVAIMLSGSDGETCELTFAIVSNPANGSLSGLADHACSGGGPFTDQAAVTYTPANGFAGSDQFTYSVTDGDGESAQATVDIDVIDPTAVDYNLVRVRARANKETKLEAVFVIKSNGNRQQDQAPVELYVDDPQGSGDPACTMMAADEPGKGSTAFYFTPATGCDVTLDTKGAPAEFQITIMVKDQSPDSQTETVKIRRISNLRNTMSAIEKALRGGG